MSDSAAERLRVVVSGPTDLAIELDPAVEHSVPSGRAPDRPAIVVEELARPVGSGRRRLEVVIDGWRFEVLVEPARLAALRDSAARAAREHQPAASSVLRAHIPGRVTRLWVAAGQEVGQGQRLLAIEAMKMENELRAPHAGRVEAIAVEVGALVEREAELLRLV